MSYSVAEPTNLAGLRLRSNREHSKSLRPFLSVYNTDFSNIFVPKIYVSAQQHWTPIVELIYTIQMLELVFFCLLYCLLWANLRSSEIPRTVSCIYLLTKLEKLVKECALTYAEQAEYERVLHYLLIYELLEQDTTA